MAEKIAVLTHCIANNYGANLQALSTACYLKGHGYDPVFLQWGDYISNNTPKGQAEIHSNFLRGQGFEMSRRLSLDEDFTSYMYDNCISRIIVGSDCVLTYQQKIFPFRLTRKGIVKVPKSKDYEFPNPFWLPFLSEDKTIRRCMMSASCGGGSSLKISDSKVKTTMGDLLDQFHYISVRDSFTCKFVRELLPKRSDIKLTPDPVFGFNNNVTGIPSEESTKSKFGLQEPYFVISFYHQNWPKQEWADAIMKESHKLGIKCIGVPMPQGGRNSSFDIDIDLPLSPLDWYALIKYSKGYIGNNMHPIIVAMHNNVPFYSFNIHGRSFLHGRIQMIKTSKEFDLLKQFSLQGQVAPQPFIKFISTKSIVSKLVSFDSDKCRKASTFMQNQYDKMMAEILQVLE